MMDRRALRVATAVFLLSPQLAWHGRAAALDLAAETDAPGPPVRLAFSESPQPPLGAIPTQLQRKPKPSPPPKAGQGPAEPDGQEQTEANSNPDGCLSPQAIHDTDGDITRNLAALSSDALCLKQELFDEGPLHWDLQIIQNKKNPKAMLWAVPHDNENAAFDTAVHGVTTYGGTIVAVETGGSRFNGSQDPNRNFDAGTGLKCPQQVAPSPEYTKRFMKWWSPGKPIIALHTNERGYSGDGHGGQGGISIVKPLPGNLPFPALHPIQAQSPNDTMVFVASLAARPEQDPELYDFIEGLRGKGVNVMYEPVSRTRNDCSMSNYAALKGVRDYFNVEVVHGDTDAQRRVVGIIMQLLGQKKIDPLKVPGVSVRVPPGSGQEPPPSNAPDDPIRPPPGSPGPSGPEQSGSPGPVPPRGPHRPGHPAAIDPPQQIANNPDGLPTTSTSRPAKLPPLQTTGKFFYQWYTLPTQAGADQERKNLKAKYEGILGNYRVSVMQVKAGAVATSYRVLVGPFASKDEGLVFCQNAGKPDKDCNANIREYGR